MRVLVTGASGTLAPFVIRALWEWHEVVLLSRRPPHAEFAALPWIQGDITVFDDCWRAVQGMDAIQHLAAQPWPVDHPPLRKCRWRRRKTLTEEQAAWLTRFA